MRRTRIALVVAMMGIALMASSCKRDMVAEKYHPAKVEETETKGIMKITLDARAAERIGLETATVKEETIGGAARRVVPYGAIMYDTKGEAWTFTNPQPLVYVRQPIVVESIDGDRVILSEGPSAGTVVVTVGAAELMGAEHKYGH